MVSVRNCEFLLTCQQPFSRVTICRVNVRLDLGLLGGTGGVLELVLEEGQALWSCGWLWHCRICITWSVGINLVVERERRRRVDRGGVCFEWEMRMRKGEWGREVAGRFIFFFGGGEEQKQEESGQANFLNSWWLHTLCLSDRLPSFVNTTKVSAPHLQNYPLGQGTSSLPATIAHKRLFLGYFLLDPPACLATRAHLSSPLVFVLDSKWADPWNQLMLLLPSFSLPFGFTFASSSAFVSYVYSSLIVSLGIQTSWECILAVLTEHWIDRKRRTEAEWNTSEQKVVFTLAVHRARHFSSNRQWHTQINNTLPHKPHVKMATLPSTRLVVCRGTQIDSSVFSPFFSPLHLSLALRLSFFYFFSAFQLEKDLYCTSTLLLSTAEINLIPSCVGSSNSSQKVTEPQRLPFVFLSFYPPFAHGIGLPNNFVVWPTWPLPFISCLLCQAIRIKKQFAHAVRLHFCLTLLSSFSSLSFHPFSSSLLFLILNFIPRPLELITCGCPRTSIRINWSHATPARTASTLEIVYDDIHTMILCMLVWHMREDSWSTAARMDIRATGL